MKLSAIDRKKIVTNILFAGGMWLLILRQMCAMLSIFPLIANIGYIYSNKMLFLAAICLILEIVINRLRAIDVVLLVWAYCTIHISNNTMMFVLILLMLAARYVSHEYVALIWLTLVAPIILACIVGYACFLPTDSPYIFIYAGRWTFFFNHPNSFGLWFTFSILAILYLIYNKVPDWSIYVILMLGAVFLFFFSECKTDTIVLLLLIPLLWLSKKHDRMWRWVVYAIPIVSILMTVLVTYMYYSGKWLCDYYFLHKSFSMRFQDAAVALTQYNVNWLGQKIIHLGQEAFLHGVRVGWVSLDNGPVALLLYYGIVGFAVLMILFFKELYCIEKRNDKFSLQITILSIVFLMGIMEWPAWYGTIGFPMLFLADEYDSISVKLINGKIRKKGWHDKKKSEIT